MKKIPLIIFSALVLVSCTARLPQPQLDTMELTQPPAVEPVLQTPATSEPVFMPPKIITIDWQVSLSPLVQQIVAVAVDSINDGSVLLINTMENSTNGSLQTSKATLALTKLITDAGRFQVVGIDKLNLARQTLGLSVDDSLESRSKAVGLARYLNAQYVLYSTASGDAKQPDLDLQLILVQTGEIIWSSKSVA